MPNSVARRANRYLAFATGFVFLVALPAALPPSAARAAEPTTATHPTEPPEQITASFTDKDNFIARLRQQGVSDSESRLIDKMIRSSLTPAQRKRGALVQLTFGGDGWPRTLQSLRLEPLDGASLTVNREAVVPTAKAAPAGNAAAATKSPPVTAAPAIAPVAVQPTRPAAEGKQEFGTATVVAPAAGATDPEWPVQPPKPAAMPKPDGRSLTIVRGTIGSDVAHSMQGAGLPSQIAAEISQAVTLHAPLRSAVLKGGHFNIAYEPASETSFLMAEFAVPGGNERIWRYRPAGGVPGFYTDSGVRIGGVAMQSPVPGAPVVSPYGMRKHPVLRVNKMHWGVDYEANTGTPILAAADGTVADVRRLGNYGLYVKITHNDGVETTYGHLSRFEQGMHPGTPVKAGQIIAYAGRSGLASGPHLYFEVFVDGKRVDPEQIVSKEPVRLAGTDLTRFENLKQHATAVQAAERQ